MRREPLESVAWNERAWERKRPWHAIHSDCYRFARPGINPYFDQDGYDPTLAAVGAARGIEMGEDVFDSTLATAAARVTNRFMQSIFPAGQHWVKMARGRKTADDPKPTKQEQRTVQTIETAAFNALNASGFYRAAHETMGDGFVAGTGVMRIAGSSDKNEPLDIGATSQVEVALEPGANGTIWGYHRKMLLDREYIQAMWPGGTLPPKDPPRNSKTAEVERLKHTVFESTYFHPESGWWYYDVLARGVRGAEVHRILEERHPLSRWIGWRWSRLPGEVYGRSPVMDALPDARTASQLVATLLANGSIRVAGVHTITEDAALNIDQVRMESGEFIVVRSNSSSDPSIRALDVGGDLHMGQIILSDLRDSIRAAALDRSLPDRREGQMTAREVIERMKEVQMDIGPAFNRIAEEMAVPVLQATVYALQQQKKIAGLKPVAPQSGVPSPMVRLDGSDIDVSFQSPLTQSQKLVDVANTVRGVGMAREAAGEAALQAAINAPKMAAEILRKMDAIPDAYRDPDEAEALYQQMLQAQMPAPQESPEGEVM